MRDKAVDNAHQSMREGHRDNNLAVEHKHWQKIAVYNRVKREEQEDNQQLI